MCRNPHKVGSRAYKDWLPYERKHSLPVSGGYPAVYTPRHAEAARKLVELGANDFEISQVLGVSPTPIIHLEGQVLRVNAEGAVARIFAKTAVGTSRPPLSQYKTCDQLRSANRISTPIAAAISKRLRPGSIGKTS